jgi:hypothetical protein
MQTNNRRLQLLKSDGRQRRRKKQRGANSSNQRRGSQRISYVKAGQQALSDLNYLRGFINTEIHYLDTASASSASSTTATFVLLNGMVTGDTAITRTGNSIKMVSLDIRSTMTMSVAAATSYNRVLIVLDKQPNAAIFAINLLLNATNPRSPYVVEGQQRFVVLYDKTFCLVINNTQCIIDEAKATANQHVTYNNTNGGGIADINTNSLYLIFFSDQAVNTVDFAYYARLWFVDN